MKFLQDRSVKQAEDYSKFYKEYGLFLKEGIVTSNEQSEKVIFFNIYIPQIFPFISSVIIKSMYLQEDIGKLLRFESSATSPGELISLPQYCSRFTQDQKYIYYLSAPR